MNNSKINALFALAIFTLLSSCNSGGNSGTESENAAIKINLSDMKKIGNVDERFQSYNVEMVEVVGGDFWKPYKMMDSLPSLESVSTYDVRKRTSNCIGSLNPLI